METNNILDDKFSNVDFSKVTFRGKLAGKSWKLEQALDRLAQVRIVIFVMTALVFYPVFVNYFVYDVFTPDLFIERLVFSLILLLCGIFFEKNRLIAIIAALLPLGLILAIYLFLQPEYFSVKRVGFLVAIFSMVALGILFHFKAKRFRKELVAEVRKGNPLAIVN